MIKRILVDKKVVAVLNTKKNTIAIRGQHNTRNFDSLYEELKSKYDNVEINIFRKYETEDLRD